MEGDRSVEPRPRRAMATMPPQPAARQAPGLARIIGTGVLAAALGTLGGLAIYRLLEQRRVASSGPSAPHIGAARKLAGAASVLSLSVLADSGVEHYRGAFHNPAMYVGPTVAAVSLANSLHMTIKPEHLGATRTALCVVALATGLTGTGYHVYNVAKRDGGVSLLNLFYGAPLGAPFAIGIAGLAGLAASRLVVENEAGGETTLLQRPAGPLIALGTAGGLFGTVAEAALLHFRGAFHNPFMFTPVTLPPVSALFLLTALARPELQRKARMLLRITALIGMAGTGFHAYGIHRNMGGWRNWSQNLLNGPPLPAPPAFTGLAFAGLAALDLMEQA